MKLFFAKSFLFALALLVVAELATRLCFTRSMSGRFDYGYNPTSGFQENTDGSVNLIKSGGRRFFPQTFQRERPAGRFRIMVVGDSVSRGPSPEQSYGGQMAAQLQAQGLKAESIDLGMPGYGARRKEVVWKQSLTYAPSLMILHFNNSNEYEDEREYNRSLAFNSWHPRNWLMKSYAIRRLNEVITEKIFWAWLPTEIRSQQEINDADAKLSASINPEKLRAWNEGVNKCTAECLALAHAQHVPVVIVTQAHMAKSPSGKSTLDDNGLDAMANSFAGEGVYILSMKDILESQPFETLFSGDGTHLRAEGHAVIAKALVDLVNQQKLATSPRN